MASIIGNAQSQDWVGTYTTDTTCAAVCCCISGTVVLTRPTRNVLAITSGLRGDCYGETQFSAQITYPTAYSVDVALGPQILRCTLSADSKQVTATNLAIPQCSGTAYKNGVIKRDPNVLISFALMTAAFFLNYSKEWPFGFLDQYWLLNHLLVIALLLFNQE
jgi:hypothetical protein